MKEAPSFNFSNHTVLPPNTTKSITNIRTLLPKIIGSIIGVAIFVCIVAILAFFRRRPIEAWWRSRSKGKSSAKTFETEVPGLPNPSTFEDIELAHLPPQIPTPAHSVQRLSTDRFSWFSIGAEKRKSAAEKRVSALIEDSVTRTSHEQSFGGFPIRKMTSDASLRSLHDEHQKKANRQSIPLDQIAEADEVSRKGSDSSVDTIDGLDDHIQDDEVSAFNYKMNQERWLGKQPNNPFHYM